MDQKFEGTPRVELRLEGRKVVRSGIENDWGSRLQWGVRRDGVVVATPVARRTAHEYEHPQSDPGRYEVVLQMFKYEGYKKDASGNYTQSHYVDVSNTVAYTT